MEEFYNKHYIRIREDGCIVNGFSDAFREPVEDDICINERGGYQFRFSYKIGELYGEKILFRSEENPNLFDWNGMIPLYRWTEEKYIVKRTDEEIEAERALIPPPEPARTVWDELDAAYQEGVDSV